MDPNLTLIEFLDAAILAMHEGDTTELEFTIGSPEAAITFSLALVAVYEKPETLQ